MSTDVRLLLLGSQNASALIFKNPRSTRFCTLGMPPPERTIEIIRSIRNVGIQQQQAMMVIDSSILNLHKSKMHFASLPAVAFVVCVQDLEILHFACQVLLKEVGIVCLLTPKETPGALQAECIS